MIGGRCSGGTGAVVLILIFAFNGTRPSLATGTPEVWKKVFPFFMELAKNALDEGATCQHNNQVKIMGFLSRSHGIKGMAASDYSPDEVNKTMTDDQKKEICTVNKNLVCSNIDDKAEPPKGTCKSCATAKDEMDESSKGLCKDVEDVMGYLGTSPKGSNKTEDKKADDVTTMKEGKSGVVASAVGSSCHFLVITAALAFRI